MDPKSRKPPNKFEAARKHNINYMYSSTCTNNIIKSKTNTNGRTTTSQRNSSADYKYSTTRGCSGLLECGRNGEVEGVGEEVGSAIDDFPTHNELVPAITAEVLMGSGNCSGRKDGRIRSLQGPARLECHHDGFLLECGHCGIKDTGYPGDLCDAHCSKMVSIHSQGGRCEAADDPDYKGADGTCGGSTERETGNSSSPLLYIGSKNRRHSPVDTEQRGICQGRTHEYRVYHDHVQTRENDTSTRSVHAAPSVSIPTREGSAGPGGKGRNCSYPLDDAVHERQGTRFEPYKIGTEKGELGALLAVAEARRPHSDGSRWSIASNNDASLASCERDDALAVPQLGPIQFFGRTRDDAARWPLHVKNHVKTLNEGKAMSMMTHEEVAYYRSVRRFFEEPFLTTVQSSGESRGQLSQADVNALLTAGLIERASPTNLKTTPMLHVFSVPEFSKRRRRLICHTVDINEASLADELPRCSFGCLDSLLDSLLDESKGEWHAWTVDIASYYHQFSLDASVRKFFRFKVPGIGEFQLCSIATGQRHCVARAQAFSRFLMRISLSSSGHLPQIVDVYIDNFLVAFDCAEAARKTKDGFMAICNTLGVTLNEFAGPQGVVGLEHRGVVFQSSGSIKTAKISAKTQQKLTEALRHIHRSPTLADVLSIFGVCQYASRVHRLPLFPFYHIYKFIRRRSRLISSAELSLNDNARIWPSIVGLWEVWIGEVLRTFRTPLSTSCPYHIVSDASNSGWGAVIFPPSGTPFAVAGSWAPTMSTLHINAKELLALTLATTHVPRGEKLKLFLDNTSAIAAINNSRSRSFTLNNLLKNLLPYYEIASVDYVPSANNIADGLSRGQFGEWNILSNN